jgi:hypothetical protein
MWAPIGSSPRSASDATSCRTIRMPTCSAPRLVSGSRTSTTVWRRLFKLAGLDFGRHNGVVWHTLRHEFCSRTAENTGDLVVAQELARHIHLFPALPVSAAVEFGRVWMPKADLPFTVYEQCRTRGFQSQLKALSSTCDLDTPLNQILQKHQWPQVWAAVRAEVGQAEWPVSIPWPGLLSSGPKTVRELIWQVVAALPKPDAAARESWT